MKTLEINELEIISAGSNDTVSSFCAGFGAVAAVYELGVLANIWNPIGWGGALAGGLIGAACVVNELT